VVASHEAGTEKRLKTVLYVDDEPLSQKYFRASISPFAEVLTASNPIEARRILDVRGDTIAVVVSDERMPVESGVPFLANVRYAFPAAQRVLTSAYADTENLQQAINEAAICYFVPKPWDLDQLCQAVRDALTIQNSDSAVPGKSSAGTAHVSHTTAFVEFADRLDQPLQAMGDEALHIVTLAGGNGVQISPHSLSHVSAWSLANKLNQIASSAARMHKAAAACHGAVSAMRDFAIKPKKLQ
jgi:two-component system, probable response regulator PhcQ